VIGEASQPSIWQPGYVFGAPKASSAPGGPANYPCKACCRCHSEPTEEAAKLTTFLTCRNTCGGGGVRRIARKLFLLALLYFAATSPKAGKIVTLRG